MTRFVSKLFSKLFGSRNKRLIKKYSKTVAQINQLEASMQALSEEAITAKTAEFKARFEQGESLAALLPEAFALVREASVRTLKMRHFDVQLIGGMVLNDGKIAEMCTGEGKTLMSTLPVYLNALSGKSVHLVTVNDYLAKRDAEWMMPLYDLLGLTVGVNLPDMTHEQKQQAYAADITYGTNNEFGFDYLRDNMCFTLEEKVQRDLSFAIVDEVDSILVDEARTPLIISGAAEDSSELYRNINAIVPSLQCQADKEAPGDYSVDEKNKQAFLSEDGHQTVEDLLRQKGMIQEGESLYDPSNIILMHHLNAALRAHALYQKDVDYIVRNNEVIIVDEHTGRTMQGRRWSDGLHQAIEAKEGVDIQNENQTLASITFQNYFRIYEKLSGMTGTADTEAFEFHQIYNLEVVVIPTNKPLIRKDMADLVYMTADEKFEAIVEHVETCKTKGQPVLVGTVSIEVSEYLSQLFNQKKIPHKVLNAKFHAQEAEIVAQAGRPGSVTIATNMAGRGTDIVLGGNVEMEIASLISPPEDEVSRLREEWKLRHQQVLSAGGLCMIGTERHESRRIDNQLRGRAGRQGDPGASRFYLSLEDNLLRIFAADRVKGLMKRFGMERGTALESGLLTRCIENAQRKVEAHNFDVRKQLLEYDDVANDQRQVVYHQRHELMVAEDVAQNVHGMRFDVITSVIQSYIAPESLEEQWDLDGLERCLKEEFSTTLDIKTLLAENSSLHEEKLHEVIHEAVKQKLLAKEETIGVTIMRAFEKSVMLQCLDSHWKEHLAQMDHLRQGIHLRGYAQKNPKQEYKREAFNLFTLMLDKIKRQVISILCSFELRSEQDVEAVEKQRKQQATYTINAKHEAPAELGKSPEDTEAVAPVRSAKVGRNEPCPCGSEKKYKHCHGIA